MPNPNPIPNAFVVVAPAAVGVAPGAVPASFSVTDNAAHQTCRTPLTSISRLSFNSKNHSNQHVQLVRGCRGARKCLEATRSTTRQVQRRRTPHNLLQPRLYFKFNFCFTFRINFELHLRPYVHFLLLHCFCAHGPHTRIRRFKVQKVQK
jgi:hypothetical protein